MCNFVKMELMEWSEYIPFLSATSVCISMLGKNLLLRNTTVDVH